MLHRQPSMTNLLYACFSGRKLFPERRLDPPRKAPQVIHPLPVFTSFPIGFPLGVLFALLTSMVGSFPATGSSRRMFSDQICEGVLCRWCVPDPEIESVYPPVVESIVTTVDLQMVSVVRVDGVDDTECKILGRQKAT